jgi:iron complex transport system substrate-binding protein
MIRFPHEELRAGSGPPRVDSPLAQLYHPRAMNQRAAHRPLLIFLMAIATAAAIVGAGCNSRSAAKPAGIASLVPAATDLLLAMGARDHIVAVSNYDTTPATAALPRVGDYQTTDWEKISQIHPAVIVTEYGPGQTPPGFSEHCADLGIHQINLQISRLGDIFAALTQLGDAADMPDRAAAATKKLHDQIDAVWRRTNGLPRVPALIVTGDSGLAVAGAGTYLDDLLTMAGGKNLAPAGSWPMLDRERLASLAPQAIIQLLPNATASELQSSRQLWATIPNIPAVRDHRVTIITDSWAELPGYEIGELAEKFAEALHPTARSSAASAPVAGGADAGKSGVDAPGYRHQSPTNPRAPQ